MGRTPGATAASTRERLPRAAADVFALSLAAGTALVTPGLNDVDDEERAALPVRLLGALAPIPAQTGSTP